MVSAATCLVLAQVFPVLVLAVALEGRSVHRRIVRLRLFQWLTGGALVTGMVGIGVSVVGVQLEGLNPFFGAMLWGFAFIVFGTSFVFLVMVVATNEVAASVEPSEAEVSRLELLADFIRGRRSA